MTNQKVNIQASIQAPLKKVWDYYTEPAHITQWNFADSSWHCPSASNDLRVGGKYVARMEAKDGSFGFDFATTYDEVILHQKLAYTMEDGRQAIMTLDQQEGSVLVTVLFDAENENPIELQRDGWQAILNNFKMYVETHP